MKKSLTLAIHALCLVFACQSVSVLAATKEEEALKKTLNANLAKIRPGLQAQAVEKSNVENLFEATLNNGDVVYTFANGKYLLAGNVFRLDDEKLVDVREEKIVPLRAKTLAAIPLSESINFVPGTGQAKAVIHIFTDVDCGYCQKMHAYMPDYNALGIEVRYLAFPRAGANSISAKKLVNAWCAEDRNDAMNKLKARQNLPDKSCANPVAAQFALGQQLGVTGTPAVYKADGALIGGYLTPQQLAQALGL
jgi:thiol:disulfide interchange protein DsbC